MGSNALAFLKIILPDSGYYAAFTKVNEQRKYNRFFATIEELAAHITLEDQRGVTVYHACSSFKEPINRLATNAWGAKSLWIDVDAGKPDSPYATAVDAAEAVFRFIKSCNLPPPLCVGSGYGVHCYWPLSASLGPADWLELASGLKGAALAHGLSVDPSRTTDLASVLRTPGTHNRKLSEIRPVVAGPLVGAWPYVPEHFDELLEYRSALHNGVRNSLRADVGVQYSPPPLTQALIVEPDYAPVRADDIADQCAQVGWLRDAKGCTPEPHWYAVLGVLSRCVDGQEKAHEWSKGHPQYQPLETDNKYQRTLALTGATTCAKFESINVRHCQGCPFKGKITSPISIFGSALIRGTVGASSNALVVDTDAQTSAQAQIVDGGFAALPVLPEPFGWSARSELVCHTAKGEQNIDVTISRYPIYLAGIGVGEVRDDRFSYQFCQWLPHRGWFDIHIGAGKLVGPGGGSELAERGATIHDHKLFVNYVRAAADAFHASERLKMQYDQCGWKENNESFLVGDALYTQQGVQENVTVSPELRTRAQWLGPQAGTLDGWSGAANALFAAGCEAQSFALACTFAAVLMRLQSTDEGGAVVNLLSRGSGTGKTTALLAVYTAWGKKQGLSLTKIDTRVSKAITLGVLGNLPVVYDEMGDRDPLVIREFITMFTNGRDKMRGTADGTIQHTQAAWQTLMISGSNQSIHDILAHTGGSDALAYRVLEYQCQLPEGVVASKGDQLRRDMEQNAGWAGDAYIDYLLQPGVMGWVQENLVRTTAELWEKFGNRPEHRFWMRTLGAAKIAGTIVNNLGILQFSPERVVSWALENTAHGRATYTAATKQTRERDTLEQSVSRFGEFLSDHIDTVLVMRKAYQLGQRQRDLPVTLPRRNVYMRYELDTHRLFISDRILRQWLLKHEIGSHELLSDLERIGVIATRRRYATLTAGAEGLVGAQISCVEVDGNHPAISGALSGVPVRGMVEQDNQPAAAQ